VKSPCKSTTIITAAVVTVNDIISIVKYRVISLFGLVLRSAELLSKTAVTHRPQGVIIVGIYMSSNIYYYYYHRI